MPSPAVRLVHYAFVAPARWVDAADAALVEYARTDDASVLAAVLQAWDESVDRDRVSARALPVASEWSERITALAAAGLPSIGERREVARDAWELLGRSARRLARLEALSGPDFVIASERELAQRTIAMIDAPPREPVGIARTLEPIPTRAGGEVLDLSRYAMAVAELAAGAFPRSVGRGIAIEESLPASLRGRMQELASLDAFWEIDGSAVWEDGPHASRIVPDEALWAPREIRATPMLVIPEESPSPTCRAWRSLHTSLPVGDRGGPMFVSPHAADERVISFVLAQTPESLPFLASEDDE